MQKIFASMLLVAGMVASIVPVHAGETVTRVIEADVPMVIDGQWLYSPFTVVLTDSNVTVNGVTYVKPWHEKPPVPIPSKEESFIDWLVRTAQTHAQEMVDRGESTDSAFEYMKEFFLEYADPDTLEITWGHHAFGFVHRGDKFTVTAPRGPREVIPPPRVWKYEPRFEEVCLNLSLGHFILRSTEMNMPSHIINPERYPDLVQTIKRLSEGDDSLKKYIRISGFNGHTFDINKSIIEKMRQVRREKEMMRQ